MNSSAAKNLAMQLATGTYKGVKSIGRAVRRIGKSYNKGFENVRKSKEAQGIKMMEENFGNVENYKKIHGMK